MAPLPREGLLGLCVLSNSKFTNQYNAGLLGGGGGGWVRCQSSSSPREKAGYDRQLVCCRIKIQLFFYPSLPSPTHFLPSPTPPHPLLSLVPPPQPPTPYGALSIFAPWQTAKTKKLLEFHSVPGKNAFRTALGHLCHAVANSGRTQQTQEQNAEGSSPPVGL